MAAANAELAIKRDTRIMYEQYNMSKVLTCLGYSLSDILKGNINTVSLIESNSYGDKITACILHQETQSRKLIALAEPNKDEQ